MQHYDRKALALKDIEKFVKFVNDKKTNADLNILYLEIEKTYGMSSKYVKEKIEQVKILYPNISINSDKTKLVYIGD